MNIISISSFKFCGLILFYVVLYIYIYMYFILSFPMKKIPSQLMHLVCTFSPEIEDIIWSYLHKFTPNYGCFYGTLWEYKCAFQRVNQIFVFN